METRGKPVHAETFSKTRPAANAEKRSRARDIDRFGLGVFTGRPVHHEVLFLKSTEK